jgi:hypothetical protein
MLIQRRTNVKIKITVPGLIETGKASRRVLTPHAIKITIPEMEMVIPKDLSKFSKKFLFIAQI